MGHYYHAVKSVRGWHIVLCSLFTLATFGCEESIFVDDDTDLREPTEELPEALLPEPINFLEPTVGQSNRYVLLTGNNYRNAQDHSFQYERDTLVIRIVKRDEWGWLVEENLTPHSGSRNGDFLVALPEKTFSYYLVVDRDQERFRFERTHPREMSRLVFGEDVRCDTRDFEDAEVKIVGWKTDLPYVEHDIEAFVKHYTQLGSTYPRLNVWVNNDRMKQDLPGQTLVFDESVGIVRATQYSPLTNQGYGWDLLPW